MSLLLGFPLDDFATTLEREACEARSLLNRLADMLVQDAAKDLKRHGLQEQGSGSDIDDREAIMVKSQNLIKQINLLSGTKDDQRLDENFFFRHSTGFRSSSRTSFNISYLL